MKKYFILLPIALFFISCSQSQEDKANAIIKAELRKSLYLPDSYKPIDTKVDSAFAPLDSPELFEKLDEFGKIAREVSELDSEIKSARSSMSIWSGSDRSAFARNEYNEAKEKYDKANEKIITLQEKGRTKLKELYEIMSQNRKFIGYRITHNYRADNNAGSTLIGNDIFILDPELKEVLYHCEVDEYKEIQDGLKDLNLIERFKNIEL